MDSSGTVLNGAKQDIGPTYEQHHVLLAVMGSRNNTLNNKGKQAWSMHSLFIINANLWGYVTHERSSL